MSQPTPLSIFQLNQYATRIRQGGLSEVRAVYSELNGLGYRYGGWALGVATGSTITGQMALSFLDNTALFGFDAQMCRNLTAPQLDALRVTLGLEHLKVMIDVARRSGGVLYRDTNYQETTRSHLNGLSQHGYTLNNWTLYQAMEVIRRTDGEAAVNRWWTTLRDTGGSGADAIAVSTALFTRVGTLALTSDDPSIRQIARGWLRNVAGPAVVDANDPLQLANRGVAVVVDAYAVDAKELLQLVDRGITRFIASFSTGTDTPSSTPAGTSTPTPQPATEPGEPVDTTAPPRDSHALVSLGGNHTGTILKDGSVWDLWVVQRYAPNGVRDWDQFQNAVRACNPEIADINRVMPGQVVWMPSKESGDALTLNLSNGDKIMSDPSTGTYRMEISNGQGGRVICVRESRPDSGYQLSQTTLDAQGHIVEQITGFQANHDAEFEVLSRQRTSDDAAFDAWDGLDPFSDTGLFTQNTSGHTTVNAPRAPLADIGTLFNAEERLQREFNAGWLRPDQYYAFQAFTIDYSLAQPAGTGAGLGLQPPTSGSFWSDPIGAFYDSQSTVFDNAASIAERTGVLLDSQGRRVGLQQLAALDANADGTLGAQEAQGLSLWRDLNEDGQIASSEITALTHSNEGPLARKDWALRTQGLAITRNESPITPPSVTGVPDAPGAVLRLSPVVRSLQPFRPFSLNVPNPSSYRLLRDTDNVYNLPNGQFIPWSASQVKINYMNRDVMVGTDGNDAFNASYYSAYGSWFNLGLLARFMGGGGDDLVGGSSRADSIWGGTGNDGLWGYDGNDKLYGEEGDDEILGEAGNDTLDGGIGNDTLFGGVGNDAAYGGEGNDVLLGFNPTNSGSQVLPAGASDNDVLFGEAGNDDLYGAWGDDTLDGGAGDDALLGQAGNDKLWGGEGRDELQGGDGNDQLMGDAGNDALFGQTGNDTLWGGEGDDVVLGFNATNEAQQTLGAGQTDDDLIFGEGGNDDLRGGLGHDTVDGGTGNDLVQGGEGNDLLVGADGDDRVFGQVGNDTLWGGNGNDLLVGFTGSDEAQQTLRASETDDDLIFGEGGHDELYGYAGQDSLDGGTGDDLLNGGEGDDLLAGGQGQDELQGGQGNDRLVGDAQDDRLFGQVGNDTLWGGEGNDLLYGFTGTNEVQQSLRAGETDDDVLVGGNGSDILVGGEGRDTLYGGTGRDELQGSTGHDLLFGDEGDDNLFGQTGDDQLYGGEGDDFLMGFTASNEAKQTLAEGESDDDGLFGGEGRDTLVGGWGRDWLDGGAGADVMVGGHGDDTYIVNSVNDVVYEAAGEGHDTVYTSTTHLLGAYVEDLHLLEGYAIHGTGNAQDNRITGNSSDNILDGVTGADTMAGGLGNDTYYVDNAGDRVVEQAGAGTDSAQSSISYTLADEVENLILLDFSKPEHGLVDGRSVLVYGYPKRNELDYMQGDAVPNFLGTCALTSIANLLTQMGRPTTESQVVTRAIDNGWTVSDPALPAWQLGGTRIDEQRQLLDSYGIRNQPLLGYNETGLANLLRGGRGVVVALNAGVLWNEAGYRGDGAVNHAVTLSGAVYANDSGELVGFYLSDSGRGRVNDMTRFVDIATFRAAADVAGAYALFTLDPVKLWTEDIDSTGNASDNTLAGNRGHNHLSGLAGNDMLRGGAGNDTLDGGAGDDVLAGDSGNDIYRFGRGEGRDRIVQTEARADDQDVLQLADDITTDQLWFSRLGDDLVIDIVGTREGVILTQWYTDESLRIDQIRTSNGGSLASRDVHQLVEAMAAFSPPAVGQMRISTQDTPHLTPVLASSWQTV